MRISLGLAALGCAIVLAGYGQTPQQKQADDIRRHAKEQADSAVQSANRAAEAVRNQDPAGQNIPGHTNLEFTEQRAKAIEADGKFQARSSMPSGNGTPRLWRTPCDCAMPVRQANLLQIS